MASRKTWIWIIVGIAGACLLCLFILAGAGVYFVTRHIGTERVSASSALQAFDRARAAFKDQQPLVDLDALDRPRTPRPLSELPTSSVTPDSLYILAWNPDEDRLVRISIPFWMLRIGRRKLDFANGDRSLNFDRLHLDVNELERIGPALVLDLRRPSGERVLLWTQ